MNNRKLFVLLLLFLSTSACSWQHLFIIKNNTDQVWNISYELNFEPGIFQSMISVYKRKDLVSKNVYTDKKIDFELAPGQYAIIGKGRNTRYRWYKNYKAPPQNNLDRNHLNVSTFQLSSTSCRHLVSTDSLEYLSGKNNAIEFNIKLNQVIKKACPNP